MIEICSIYSLPICVGVYFVLLLDKIKLFGMMPVDYLSLLCVSAAL